jgi:hypothetical protein
MGRGEFGRWWLLVLINFRWRRGDNDHNVWRGQHDDHNVWRGQYDDHNVWRGQHDDHNGGGKHSGHCYRRGAWGWKWWSCL